MDGMVFKVKKDGVIQKCTAYARIGVDLDSPKEVLNLHIGGAESAKYWVSVMNDLKNRGVQDVLIFCTDNLTRISDAIKACFPNPDHQKCIVHQIRNSVKHVSYKDLKQIWADLKAIYTAPTADAGMNNLETFANKWDKKYGYISKNWLELGATVDVLGIPKRDSATDLHDESDWVIQPMLAKSDQKSPDVSQRRRSLQEPVPGNPQIGGEMD